MNEFQCVGCHGTDFKVLANEGDLVCKGCGKHFDIFVTQLKIEVITKEELREKLAALEHKQWAHWTEYMLTNMSSENREKWFRQIRQDYEELTEEEKESDREWADKILSIVSQCVIELGGEECQTSGQRRRNGNRKRYRRKH